MIHPSGIQAPKDFKVKVKEVKKGLYVVENAYEGNVEYFPERAGEFDLSEEEENNTEKTVETDD